jgi:hypothetical protein
MARRKLKTYDAEFKGRKVRVTVPENDEAKALGEAIKDNLSPEAVATLANAVRVHVNGRRTNPEVRRQLDWLANRLVTMLGGENAYHDLLKEAGF